MDLIFIGVENIPLSGFNCDEDDAVILKKIEDNDIYPFF